MSDKYVKPDGLLDDGISRDVMACMEVGCWIADVPKRGEAGAGAVPKLWGSAKFLEICGFDETPSPEALYEAWFARVDPNSVRGFVERRFSVMEGEGRQCEGRFLWNHPTRGWVSMRMGAYLESDRGSCVRFKGFFKDVTDQLELKIRDTDNTRIQDLPRLQIYSQYFLELNEGLLEIDPDTLAVHTIFYRDDRYALAAEGSTVTQVVRKAVHPDDCERLLALFTPESIARLRAEGGTLSAEYRVMDLGLGWRHVVGRLTYVETNGLSKLLLSATDNEYKTRASEAEAERNAVLAAFTELHRALLEIDLKTGTVRVLKRRDTNAHILPNTEMTIARYLELVGELIAVEDDRVAYSEFLGLDRLRAASKVGLESRLDIRMKTSDTRVGLPYEWLQVRTLPGAMPGESIRIVVSSIDREQLLSAITEKFVYEGCDYLFCLDLINNAFCCCFEQPWVMFPAEGEDYRKVLKEYADGYIAPEDRNFVVRSLEAKYMIERLDRDGEYRVESSMLQPDGEKRRKEILVRWYDAENRIALIQRTDVTERYRREREEAQRLARVEREANLDGLTGTFNRSAGLRRIGEVLKAGGSHALFFLDLDNFKQINDTLGHRTGDEVLRRFGMVLRENLRTSDIAVRIGGDEFIVLLRDVGGRENAQICARHLYETLHAFRDGMEAIPLTASIGIACAPEDGKTFDELYERADRALYEVKSTGKDGFTFSR